MYTFFYYFFYILIFSLTCWIFLCFRVEQPEKKHLVSRDPNVRTCSPSDPLEPWRGKGTLQQENQFQFPKKASLCLLVRPLPRVQVGAEKHGVPGHNIQSGSCLPRLLDKIFTSDANVNRSSGGVKDRQVCVV